MKTIETIRKDALALPVSERATLAHDLIVSLGNPADYELDSRQETEIARRVRMVKAGKADGRPAEQVFSDIEAKLG
jgi:putative addiction module component (TIGR02574 family)